MRNILTCFLFALSINAAAQQVKVPVRKIQGYVRDSATYVALDKATITLKNNRGIAIQQTIADSTGYFSFQTADVGLFWLLIEYSNYNTVTVPVKNGNTIPEYKLAALSRELQNVTITSEKKLVENRPDKLVYNAEKDITSQAGTVTDILRKVPQLTVDVNGNVELLGNPSVRFLINGKTSTLFGSSASEALQSIPASQVQSIEVISSPGAKYDAAGTGGIVNIILKKSRAKGFSGVVNATTGTRLENGSFNFGYKKNSVSFNGFFNGSAQVKVKTISLLTRNSVDTANGDTYKLLQDGNSRFRRDAFRAGAGLDWDITSKTIFSFSLGYNHFGNRNNGIYNQDNEQKNQGGQLIAAEANLRNAYNSFASNTWDINTDFRQKLKKEKEEFSVSFQHSRGANNTFYSQSQQPLYGGFVTAGSQSRNPGKDYLTSFSIDYTSPLSKNFTFETGFKIEAESLLSDADVYSFSPATNRYVRDEKQSYTSSFKRQVYALYVSASFQLLKELNVIAGLREEHTFNKAYYSNTGKSGIPEYNNVAPSITVAHVFSKQQQLKFSYSYRLERPEYRDLNPFINLADPHNIITGNPYIQPEIGRDFQLGYNQSLGKENNLNIVLLYTYNSPDIKSYTIFYPSFKVGDSVYNNVNVTRRSNIASENRYGINLGGTAVIKSKLTIRPGVQLYERQINNIYSVPQRISGFEYRLNMNIAWQVNKQLITEGSGNYRSGIKWQGTQAGFYTYSLALRQQLFKSTGSLGLVLVNAFGKYLTQKTALKAAGFTSVSVLHIPYRSAGISFMYKFGKTKISKPKEAENLLNKPPVEN